MQPTTITIPFNQYRFYFETEQPIRLPAFPGSAWRGAFGHALKKAMFALTVENLLNAP